ncbi:hypothetical protein [Caulobacter sp. 17J65-9]|uniref:hypothetical protein n=1 Tax=Caulobacter sp. 17J65-9 TaxID=2709382 RepID=UPI0013CABF1C|nr:hypothetical protein [Caulobacter sp. 17J65-9]NEX91295.1 hypothetical protein [Caulobacter sp. 17J65-9]
MQFVRRSRKVAFGLALTAVLGALPTPALAWKPKTHVYLAELAMRDAVDDGKVTIYQTDYATGRIIGPLGDFEVRPEVVAAMRAKPEQYLAGVVGPDAYPDLMTGQQVIHPGTNPSLLGDPAHNEPASVGGADAWLTYLWRLAYGRKDPNAERVREALNRGPLGEVAPPTDTPEIRAFVAGYMTHAAGDMFMHTFVNHYAGGDFAIQPDPRNAIKHVVLEGYVGKRTPDTHARTSIEGVDEFIYRYMVRAYPGSVLEERLLRGGTQASVPSIFSNLRNGLQRDVDSYDRERLARSGPSRVAYSTANGPVAEYKRAWIADIDRGLRAWPRVSHEISQAIVYNPDGDGADIARAKEVASAYLGDHLLSMAGAPDAVIATAQFIADTVDAILPDFMLAPLEALKKELLNWLVKQATGMSPEEIKGYLSNPETHFDRVMNAPGGGYGGRAPTLTTLAAFNRDVLKIADPGAQHMDRKFDPNGFAPAFNTLQMTKLMYLSEKGMADLLAALKAKGLTTPEMPKGVAYETAMLGFLTSMDGDNRWQGLAHGSTKAEGRAFFLARDGADAWRNLFMRQIGERADWPASSAPAQEAGGPPDDTGFVRIDWWAARVDKVEYDDGKGRNVAVTMTFRNDSNETHSFSDKIAKPVRALLNAGDTRLSPVRMDYLNTDEARMPAWHYPPTSPIPRKGRITVRFVFDVGESVRQRTVHSVSIIEQHPRSALTPAVVTDAGAKDFPLDRLNLDGSVGVKPAPTLPPVSTDLEQLKKYEGRYRTNRGTIIKLAVVDGELTGEAMTVDYPTPKEMVKLKLYADGALRGAMRETNGPGLYAWLDLEVRFAPDASSFTGQGVYTTAKTSPPTAYSGKRVADTAAKTGPAACQAPVGKPQRIGPYDVAFVCLQKGDDGDWESTWSLTNRTQDPTTVQLSDLSVVISDATGKSNEAYGPYHYAGETGRRVRRSGFEIPPGTETQIRFWHSRSRDLKPVSYAFKVKGQAGQGELPADPDAP